jgi:uncharacterized delta-60 repeat protein
MPCMRCFERTGFHRFSIDMRRSLAVSWNTFSLLPLLLGAAGARAQPSLADSSFRVGDGANAPVNALVVLADQRILAGGEFTSINGCSNAYLARLNVDGSADAAFNPAAGTDGPVYCLLQRPDGTILVGGGFQRVLGAERHGLARLTAAGNVDPSFDTGEALGTNGAVFALALQEDQRIVVCQSGSAGRSRILRVESDGKLDLTFQCTNDFFGYVFALLPLPGGGLLAGVNGVASGANSCLIRLQAGGQVDGAFTANLGSNSSVFVLARKPDGKILVGGQLRRTGTGVVAPLLQLNADLQWDDSFRTDDFKTGGTLDPTINSLLFQPDGAIVAGGYFFEVGGYWRRQILRFLPGGQVDGCFDPGLGLGGAHEAGPVRALALQTNGCVVVGGWFDGVEGASGQHNLARFQPQSSCDAIRVYVGRSPSDFSPPPLFAAATFPPGGTNILEHSENLVDWQELARTSSPYLYVAASESADQPLVQFFRARKER